MIAILALVIGAIAAIVFRAVLNGTENALDTMDKRDRDDRAERRRAWMAMNSDDREWYRRFGR